MPKIIKTAADRLFSPGFVSFSHGFWRELRGYFGLGKHGAQAIDHPHALRAFLHSRASQVSQTSLYGYMKTRAGTRFPELFTTPALLTSINIAKWHIWLACLSDLTVYSGVLLRLRTAAPSAQIHALLGRVFAQVMHEIGAPAEAGDAFAAHARAVQERIAAADFAKLQDDDSAFTASPQALVHWAPIADELKNRDTEIIRNSVRFRWQEIRRNLRTQLRAEALLTLTTDQSATE